MWTNLSIQKTTKKNAQNSKLKSNKIINKILKSNNTKLLNDIFTSYTHVLNSLRTCKCLSYLTWFVDNLSYNNTFNSGFLLL